MFYRVIFILVSLVIELMFRNGWRFDLVVTERCGRL